MPVALLRASVRRMLEFSLRGGDLSFASPAVLQEGSRAHRARQAQAAATAERAVRWQGECEGVAADIQGRIDLLWEEAVPPCIDELKLISPAAPLPEAPVPVHRMQAVCYGFMLCEEQRLDEIRVRVSYVTEDGTVRVQFEEILRRDQAKDAFFSMLRPLARWHRLEEDYRARRDAALAALPFPYPEYRPGQREMAAQVYTAIAREKRLFATLPTGTGKSAAVLFPALKALGTGKTKQVFYLTARGTTQRSALDAVSRMRENPLPLRVTVITAKEKCCPQPQMRCHPDFCPRARGYYDRELPALLSCCQRDSWTPEEIETLCEAEALCPFEFSLALCEISDLVICDYNYVFDPMVSLKRIIGQGHPVTLLIDEAHNLPGRTRDMLSGALDSREIAAMRRETGKLQGRKSPACQAMTGLLTPLRGAEKETLWDLYAPLDSLIFALMRQEGPQPEGSLPFLRELLQFRMTLERYRAQPEGYAPLFSGNDRTRAVRLLCLDISAHLRETTRRARGCVCFSATLSPLSEMKRLLGGTEEDAVFSLPSPFPPERLLVLTRFVDTRYQRRQETAEDISRSILALYESEPGRYIAYFPSYAYLLMIRERLLSLRQDLPLNIQDRSMDEAAREAFLGRMRGDGPLLSLCVLGGIFSEGIDLPGEQLIGAAIVGVGLPQVNGEQEALRDYYEQALGDGFAYAYRYPGMQKVLQAAGRVIRSERDAGAVLLLDSRYRESAYRSLLPPHYCTVCAANEEEIRRAAQEFWRLYGINKGSR